MRNGNERGFTLVELLVALLLTALAAALAHAVFGAVVDGDARLRRARRLHDRDRNAHRWLAAAFSSADVGTPGAVSFEGERNRVQFTAHLQTADGWFERREVEVRLDGDRLVAAAGARQIVLADGLRAAAFDYLPELGADTRYVDGWTSPVHAPLGVRLRTVRAVGGGADSLASDTTLFVIGERG